MNSNTNSPKKMTPSQLEGWLAIRKKCAPQKSKKAYTRKEKHKQKFEKSQDIQYNIYRKSGEELQTLFLSFEDSSPTKFVMRLINFIDKRSQVRENAEGETNSEGILALI